MSTASERKRLDERIRVCFDEQITHVRAGNWRELDNAEVTVIGLASELHGTVCTCCPKDAS